MIEQFAEMLLSCGTLTEVQRTFSAAVAREGFDSSAARAFVPRAKNAAHTFFLNWSEDWKKFSAERQFIAKSAVIREARRRHGPFTWRQLRSERPANAAETEVWTATREWGWKEGFVVPIHGPGGYLATVAMASRERNFKLNAAKQLRLTMLAIATHERCRVLSDLTRPADLPSILTARELECLKWVADGQTDEKIGTILGVSAETVRFHVDNVRSKLGVRNRAQAVAQMCFAGLL